MSIDFVLPGTFELKHDSRSFRVLLDCCFYTEDQSQWRLNIDSKPIKISMVKLLRVTIWENPFPLRFYVSYFDHFKRRNYDSVFD